MINLPITGMPHHLIQIIIQFLLTQANAYATPIGYKHLVVGPLEVLSVSRRRLDGVVPLCGQIGSRVLPVRDI